MRRDDDLSLILQAGISLGAIGGALYGAYQGFTQAYASTDSIVLGLAGMRVGGTLGELGGIAVGVGGTLGLCAVGYVGVKCLEGAFALHDAMEQDNEKSVNYKYNMKEYFKNYNRANEVAKEFAEKFPIFKGKEEELATIHKKLVNQYKNYNGLEFYSKTIVDDHIFPKGNNVKFLFGDCMKLFDGLPQEHTEFSKKDFENFKYRDALVRDEIIKNRNFRNKDKYLGVKDYSLEEYTNIVKENVAKKGIEKGNQLSDTEIINAYLKYTNCELSSSIFAPEEITSKKELNEAYKIDSKMNTYYEMLVPKDVIDYKMERGIVSYFNVGDKSYKACNFSMMKIDENNVLLEFRPQNLEDGNYNKVSSAKLFKQMLSDIDKQVNKESNSLFSKEETLVEKFSMDKHEKEQIMKRKQRAPLKVKGTQVIDSEFLFDR